MKYGQVVVGPAGSGKTNYCKMMKEFMKIKKRNCYVINLDSASEEYFYDRKKTPFNATSSIEKELRDYYDTIYDIDIRDYVAVKELIDDEQIGPNCALLRSIELFYENSHLLDDELNSYDSDETYFLIDTPGQMELYTHTDYFKKILNVFEKHDIRLIIVFLIDISFISSNTKLLSAYLTSLSTMINFELPHINLLTKCDLLSSKNYYEEFKKGEMQNNLFFQRKLYKRLHKKAKEYKEIRQRQRVEEADKDFVDEIDALLGSENSNKKTFKDEYMTYSDYETNTVSNYSSASSASSVSTSQREAPLVSSETDSFSEEEDEEHIYRKNYDKLKDLLTLDPFDILMRANKCMSKKYYKLNVAFANIVEHFNMVTFTPLNIFDDDDVEYVINAIDMITQYGEEKEVNDKFDM